MAILDTTKPVQAVQCDLCGIKFDRPLKQNAISSLGGIWEDVSIAIYPNVGKSDSLWGGAGNIRVDHACDTCREKFTAKIRALIDELKLQTAHTSQII